jgi:hypothetical protein
MRDLFGRPSTRLASALFVILVIVTACSGGSGASAGADAGSSGAGGASTVEGSLTSSGAYEATWTWQAGNAAEPDMNGITLNSDKGTFGNIHVGPDGAITFTSGAPELTAGSYSGTGAQVTMKNDAPCSFTVDNDVTGGGQTLHLKGSLTITGGVYC